MIKFIRIHHVSLLVENVARALDFYQGVLALPNNPARPDLGYPGAWLDIAAGQQLHLLQLPNLDPVDGRPAHGGRDRHIALAVEDLSSVQTALDAAGVPYTLSRSGRRALFCRDPDGNAIEWVEEGSNTP